MGGRTGYPHGTFSWVDLMAHDLAGAKTFYSSLFGWIAEDQDTQGGPPYVMFRLNGKRVAGAGQMSPDMKAQGVPPVWNSYVTVDDLEATVQNVQPLGGNVVMASMQVVDAGAMAIIQDPEGAMLSLWQKHRHFGAEYVNHPGAFCWNELATRDPEQAKGFYGQLFGWTFEAMQNAPSPYYMIQNSGRMNGGILQITPEWGDRPPFWGVYFTVEDVEAATQQLSELAGTIVQPPFDISVGRTAVVTDPQGAFLYLIQLHQIDD